MPLSVFHGICGNGKRILLLIAYDVQATQTKPLFMGILLSLTATAFTVTSNVLETASAVENQSNALPALTVATGVVGLAYFKKSKKLSRFKLKFKLLKLFLKSKLFRKRGNPDKALLYLLGGSLIGLLGFILLLTAMLSGGTVMAFVLAILLLLVGGVIFLIGGNNVDDLPKDAAQVNNSTENAEGLN